MLATRVRAPSIGLLLNQSMEAKNAQAREKLIEAEEDEIARSYPLYHHGDPYDELDETGNAHGLPQLETLPPDEMLRQFSGINISAPMVRYSKLPARFLWSRYNTHVRPSVFGPR